MNNAILLFARVAPAFRSALESRHEVLGPIAPPFAESLHTLPEGAASRVRAIITMGTIQIPEDILGRLPALALIACIGSGYEGVPVAAARRRGIEVTHSPDANSSSVADLALALLLSSMRNLDVARAWLASGKFQGNAGPRLPAARGLTGRRVGVWGLGAIGLKIARRVAAFETEVAYCNRRRRDDVEFAWHPDLMSLARWADVLIIAVRASAETRHAVNREVLDALGPEGYVINISRGMVIDEAGLVEAIAAGRIRGAGLDVFEHEPAVTPRLYELPHVALTPHIAGLTTEAQVAMQDCVRANLEAFFDGAPVINPVPA